MNEFEYEIHKWVNRMHSGEPYAGPGSQPFTALLVRLRELCDDFAGWTPEKGRNRILILGEMSRLVSLMSASVRKLTDDIIPAS